MDTAVPQLTIYNLPPSPPNWDRVGIFYITFCATWTLLVFLGMVFCWFNRSSPILKIRGLPLSFTAITFLHIYWILAQIVYPIGMTLPIVIAYDVQYFFMGIWLPLGIALFHASNSRFLHIAKLQKQFTRPELRSRSGCDGGKSSWLCRLRNMNYTKRILIFIGIGIVAQVRFRESAVDPCVLTPGAPSDSVDCWNVGCLQEVPSHFRHSRDRNPGRQPP